MATPDYQAPLHSQLLATVKFIERHVAQGSAVYVHCNAGKGRSSVVVAAYLSYTQRDRWPSAAAVVRHMRKLRPDVSFALLDWPLRSQARCVSSFFDWVKTQKPK